jgi:hypothetical protein
LILIRLASAEAKRSGLSNITTAVNVSIAADAPRNVASEGKKGRLSGKLRRPPRKKAVIIFLVLATLSSVFPKTHKNSTFPDK